MDLTREREILQLLDAALEQPTEQQMTYLEQACPDNPDLLAKVKALLQADSKMLGDVADPNLSTTEPAANADPDRVGPFRITGKLGSGGMGEVFLAVEEGLDRTVALKLMRAGFWGGEWEQRFQQEQVLLSRLNHPHIARLYAVGAGEDGRPYFAMEYVKGKPLDQYCAEAQLSLTQRLHLFTKICDAVHHAHRHLIVHRDLKPGNILVTPEGEPKLLDFGIAKGLMPETDPLSLKTKSHLRLLTPRYASPEQIRGEAVTPASDVYALGLIFYQLLTGFHPLEVNAELDGYSLEQALLTNRPKSPSTRLQAAFRTNPTDTKNMLTAMGATHPQRLVRNLRGDLDAIAMKALRKEVEHRYTSVDRLQEDLVAHLGGFPVAARKGLWWYTGSRFLLRNRWRVLVAGLILGSFTGATALQGIETRKAYRQAEQKARIAGETATLLQEAFQVSDPEWRMGETITAKEILDRGATLINEKADLAADVRAPLLQTLGKVHLKLGLYPEAHAYLKEAAAMVDKTNGAEEIHLDLADVQWRKGELSQALSSVDHYLAFRAGQKQDRAWARAQIISGQIMGDCQLFEASRAHFEAALAFYRQHEGLYAETAQAYNNLSALMERAGEPAQARFFAHQTLELNRSQLGEEHPRTVDSLQRLGHLAVGNRDFATSEHYLTAVLTLKERIYSANHPTRLETLLSLGSLRSAQQDPRTETIYQNVLEVSLNQFGENHPITGKALNGLGFYSFHSGKYKKAETYFLRVLDIDKIVYGNRHTTTALTLNNLGVLLMRLGRYQEARSYLAESISIRQENLGPDHPRIARSLVNMSLLHFYTKDYDASEKLAYQVLPVLQKKFGEHHVNTTTVISILASIMRTKGRYQESHRLYQKALDIRTETLGPNHPKTLTMRNNLGSLLEEMGDYENAAFHLEAVLATRIGRLGADHDLTGISYNNLAAVHQAQGQYEQAQLHYECAIAIHEKNHPQGHPNLAQTQGNLGEMLHQIGEKTLARKTLRNSIAIYVKVVEADHPGLAKARATLSAVLQDDGDFAEAEQLLRQALASMQRRYGPDHKLTTSFQNQLETLTQARNAASDS